MGWKLSRPDWEPSSIGVEDAVTALEQRHALDWGRTTLVAFMNEREMTVGEWRKATEKLDVAEFPWCVIQRETDTTWCVYARCKSRDVADGSRLASPRTPRDI